MPVTANEICAVVPAINFPCFVDRQALTARLTHIEENSINTIYHISFSDGYTSRFLAGTYDPRGVWIDLNPQLRKFPNTGLQYAQAITPDLNALNGFSPQRDVYLVVTDLPNSKNVNIWILQEYDEPYIYSIYYQNDYRFTLERNGTGWEAYSRRQMNPVKPDVRLVLLLTTTIDSNLQ
jgi:hypothetical protein